MTATVTQFANLLTPTGPEIDANFTVAALLAITPCTVAGANAVTLSQKTNTFTLSAYAQNMQLSGVAASSNSAATTARLNSLAFLKVYQDTPAGPVQCVGGEIAAGNAFTLMYDAALDSGAGGWHLFSTTAGASTFLPLIGGTLTGPVYMTGSLGSIQLTNTLGTVVLSPTLLSGASITSPFASLTQLRVGASAASITRILTAQATLTFSVTSANLTQDQNMTVPGAQVGDVVSIGPPSTIVAGAGYSGYIPAAGTVSVRLMNATAATLATIVQVFRARVEGYT